MTVRFTFNPEIHFHGRKCKQGHTERYIREPNKCVICYLTRRYTKNNGVPPPPRISPVVDRLIHKPFLPRGG